MSSFWLFSFERFNGILGDEPSNNRSIEIQLMNCFMQDNAHLQLLNSTPNSSSIISNIFSQAITEHVFTSKKHLDVEFDSCHVARFAPASKYIIQSFSDVKRGILNNVYLEAFPSLFSTGDANHTRIEECLMLLLMVKG